MGRGFFGGFLWGAATSGLALAALAVVTPPGTEPSGEAPGETLGETPAPRFPAGPERAAPAAPEPDSAPDRVAAPASRPGISAAPEAGPATDIDLPPGSAFNRPRPEAETLPPEQELPDEAPVRGAPAPVAVTEAPLPDTEPAAAPAPVSAMPETMAPPMGSDAALDLGGAAAPAAEEPRPAARSMRGPSAPDAVAVPAAVPEPEAPETLHETPPVPEMPAASAGPVPDTVPESGPAAGPEPGAETGPETALDPETGAEAGPDTAPKSEPESVPEMVPEIIPEAGFAPETATETAPETGPVTEPAAELATEPEAAAGAPAVLPEVLPEVLPPPEPDGPAIPERAAASEAPPPALAEGAAVSGPDAASPAAPGALARNAVPFKAPPGSPLLSLVLIDVGAEGLDRQTLLSFPFPVTFVIDAAAPDAEAAMETYRAAGYEVAVLGSGLADLAPGAAAARVGAALDRIGGSIAMLDPGPGGGRDDRDLSGPVLDVLAKSGHGLVTPEQGLNDVLRAAERAGLHETVGFRTFDDAGQTAETIQHMLDRAVSEARQNGHAVMVGHSRAETVAAVYAWALLSGPADAVLAPLSAVLRQP
ncbi:divergent polysaccharide deacetylase family protein [Rhodovulum sp. MB263]|uniref:divergent polysaccharide deacetylase family protein n=1 Tax=Rhodovulum sp. (strain MB263) TaxID=308754 RepID=UPI0009B7B71B|nr:divergent polysaccharide deacetylase family protein [Rhodovulum sp. MB263]ARC88476.1 hypothetical protein B5V46_07540 [Rhodovulum sp. MB263]